MLPNKDLCIIYDKQGYIVEEDYENVRLTVASTDSSLGLPAIPGSFLKQYVAANGKINKVSLEMEWLSDWELRENKHGGQPDYDWNNDKKVIKLVNNEVVIVDELDKYSAEVKLVRNIVDKQLEKAKVDREKRHEKFQDNGTFNIAQTLEDAALSYFMLHPYPNVQLKIKNAFKAGANWQKQQSATDAIPTDAEIEKKANNNADRYLKRFDTIAVFVGYIDGYKKALKDLGYE